MLEAKADPLLVVLAAQELLQARRLPLSAGPLPSYPSSAASEKETCHPWDGSSSSTVTVTTMHGSVVCCDAARFALELATHCAREAFVSAVASPLFPARLQLPNISNTMRRDTLLATAMAHCSAGRSHINRGEVAAGCDCLSAALSALGAAGRPALAPSLAGKRPRHALRVLIPSPAAQSRVMPAVGKYCAPTSSVHLHS
jgi:hypothetical protein